MMKIEKKLCWEGNEPWCWMFCIQKGSVGAAVPLARGAVQDVPKAVTTVANETNSPERVRTELSQVLEYIIGSRKSGGRLCKRLVVLY